MRLTSTDELIKGMLFPNTQFSKTKPIKLVFGTVVRYHTRGDYWLCMCANDSVEALVIKKWHDELIKTNMPCRLCKKVMTVTGTCCGCLSDKVPRSNKL